MKKIIYFHRNPEAGYSINKVTQTIVQHIDNKMEYYMPRAGSSIRDLLINIWFIIKHREKGAIHHITGDIHYATLGLIGYQSVLTIHDTVGIDFNKLNRIKLLIYILLWYKLPLKISNRIICISEETKKNLLRFTKRKDIRVIYNAIDPSLTFSTNQSSNTINNILFIGTKVNKNLIRCFHALKGIECHVTIIGKLTEEQTNTLISNKIHFTCKSGLTNEELNEEYKKCDIVSFCSLFEGFGMPALEANQAGRPVLCSNIPVLIEIEKDSACFVNPFDIESIREGYLQLINDVNYRNSLIRKGRENALRFHPTIITKQWIDVYKSF